MTRSKGRTGRPYRRLRDKLKTSGAPCHWCNMPIDLALPWWNPWSFTVDHVHPLAAGGAPLDPTNVVSAHRRCNQLRGYGSVPVPVVGPQAQVSSRAW